jgi:hypothetical protein
MWQWFSNSLENAFVSRVKRRTPNSEVQVLPLYETGGDILPIWIAAQNASARSDASGWTVSRIGLI